MGIREMSGALMGMTLGGAVSGLAWMDSAKVKLYNEGIEEAITNNKKLGITYEELTAFVEQQAAAGEGTRQDTAKEMYSVLTASTKYLKGGSQEKLAQADAITDFYFKHQEMMQEQGIYSAEQLVQRATMTEGKMSGRFGTKFATAMGVSVDDPSMRSAKARIQYMMQEGAKVDMKAELDKRPWEQLQVNIKKLQYAIGDSIAAPMATVTGIVARFAEILLKIPYAPALIGLLGMFLAMASAVSLTIGVLTPLLTILRAHNILVGLSNALLGTNTAAKVTNTATTVAMATAEHGAAAGAWALASGIWATLAPLLPFIIAGTVLIGVLALIADKLGILQPIIEAFKKALGGDLAGAWKQLTSIKLPTLEVAMGSIKESLAGVFSGTTFFAVITKLLGVPLYKIIDFVNEIKDLLKRIEGFIDYIIGMITKYIYTPLKGLWDFVINHVGTPLKNIYDSILKILEKLGIKSTGETKVSFSNEISKEQYGWLANAPEEMKEDFYKYASGQMTAPELRKKYPNKISDIDLKSIESAYAKSNHEPVTGALPEEEKQSPSEYVNDYLGMGYKAGYEQSKKEFAAADQYFVSGLQYWGGKANEFFSPLTEAAKKPAEWLGIPKNDIGGQVTQSGLAWVDTGEPIVPAGIARDSNLINLLENISQISGANNTNTNKDITINIEYKTSGTGTGNGRYLDDFAFERAVKSIIGKCIRTYGSY